MGGAWSPGEKSLLKMSRSGRTAGYPEALGESASAEMEALRSGAVFRVA